MNCPDCDVPPGNWHRPSCAWEQCPYCGEFRDDCDCPDGPAPLDDRLAWTGCCPWIEACLRFGFFEKLVRGAWVRCGADDPDSQPDIVRLFRECFWDRAEKRFERRQEAGQQA